MPALQAYSLLGTAYEHKRLRYNLLAFWQHGTNLDIAIRLR